MSSAPQDSRRAGRLSANPWLIFSVIGLGSFLGPLSGSIIIIALPNIGEFFHADVHSTKWVVLVFVMVSTFLMPIAGKWGQRFGEGRLYATGLAIYLLGSALCAITAYILPAQLMLLVAARAVHAVGSSMIFATSGALITKYIPPERRGVAFGIMGSIVAMALIAGPVLGAVICAVSTWEWIFWVLVPFAVLGYIASRMILPAESPAASHATLPGWSSTAWLLLVVGLTLIGEAFSKGLWTNYLWLTGLLTALALLWFILAERRGPSLFDYSLLHSPTFRLGAQGAIVMNTIVFILTLFIPFYLQIYLGIPLLKIGMLLSAAPLCSFFFGPAAGHLADRTGYRLPILTGLVTLAVGFILLVFAVMDKSLWQIVTGMALMGAGSGIYGGPNFAAMMSSVSAVQRPIASSFISLTRNIGFLAGTSLGSIALGLFLEIHGGREVMLAARSEVLSPSVVSEANFVFAFSRVLIVCAVLAVLGLIASWGFPNRAASQAQDAPAASTTSV
jgi:MFS family permease